MPSICFYHSADLDGICSGHIVSQNVPGCTMYPINYDDPFPWDLISADTDVYMVDFSLQPFTDMRRLVNTARRLVWIDHHKTAIDAFKAEKEALAAANSFAGVNKTISGLLRVGIGACELCWEYFQPEPVPYATHLLASYDVWDHSNPQTLPFQYYARIVAQGGPGDARLDILTSDSIDPEHLAIGRGIMSYEAQSNAKIAKSYAHDAQLSGLKLVAINRHPSSSLNFKAVWDPGKYDAMCAYGWKGGHWVVSLYSDKPWVDVSAVAKSYGGGGHAGAAGFHCGRLPRGLCEGAS